MRRPAPDKPNLLELINEVGADKPDLLIIECGSNDLTNLDCDPVKLAKNLLILADYSVIVHKVKLVIFCSVLLRGKCREVSRELFQQRMTTLNKNLLLGCKSSPLFCFFMFRGFWKDPIRSWSSDLIHPGTAADSDGFRKYVRNIRDCLQTAAAMLFQKTSVR